MLVRWRGGAEGVQPFMYGGLGQRSRICVIADDPTRERAADFFNFFFIRPFKQTRSSGLMAGGRKRSVYENGIIVSRRQGKIVRSRRLMSGSFHRGGLYNYETFMVSRSRARQQLTAWCVTRSPPPIISYQLSLCIHKDQYYVYNIYLCCVYIYIDG